MRSAKIRRPRADHSQRPTGPGWYRYAFVALLLLPLVLALLPLAPSAAAQEAESGGALQLGVLPGDPLEGEPGAPDDFDDAEYDYEPTPPSAYVSVQALSSGSVTFSVGNYDLSPEESAKLLDVVPRALGCNWIEQRREEFDLTGLCLNWLSAGDSPPGEITWGDLDLAPLTEALRGAGVEAVYLELSLQGGQGTQAPLGWEAFDEDPTETVFSMSFASTGDEALPLPVAIPVVKPRGVVIPMLIVLLAPALVAYLVRTRALSPAGKRKTNWMVWLNWLTLGSWLYWIAAVGGVNLPELLLSRGSTNSTINLVVGVVIYALPPLCAVAACFTAMAPLLSSSEESFKLMLRRQVVGEATLLVPLGIFIVGMGIGVTDWYVSVLSLVAAYVVYRLLAWMHWSLSYGELTTLESGDLFQRATAMASKAGVTIARWALLRTRVPEEANAFAASGDTVVLTESLVQGLPPREVDAVIAHELAHHKSGHMGLTAARALPWVYILAAWPAFSLVVTILKLPAWILTLPIPTILFLWFQGLLSQRNEFIADAGAVEITGDPEGSIASLARLARLSRMPVGDQGIMSSIMSHPSMERRVLVLARKHDVPKARALAILRDPDVAYDDPRQGSPQPVPLPLAVQTAPSQAPDPVYSLRQRATLKEQLRWLNLIGPLLCSWLLLGMLVRLSESLVPSSGSPVSVLAVSFAVMGMVLALRVLVSGIFVAGLRNPIARRLHPRPCELFVGLHPGPGVRFTEGFADWDFGYLSLEGDWLQYRGERTAFAVSRQDVTAIRVVQGPPAWIRERRIEVRHARGVFTFSPDFARVSKALALAHQDRMENWVEGAASPRPGGPPPAGLPMMPAMAGQEGNRILALWGLAKLVGKQLIGATLLSLLTADLPSMGLITLIAPAAAALLLLPGVLWPVRRPRPETADLPGATAAPEPSA